MRILVTGAAGFVGARACSHFETAGHKVVRVSHSNSAGASMESESSYVVDVADPKAFVTLDGVDKIDAIVHCAGIAHRFGRTSRDEFWRVNVDGSAHVAEFAARRGIARFVHLSSVLVYGLSNSDQPITEEQLPSPGDDYPSSKLAGEEAVESVCKAAGIKLVILRPVPIIGEGSRGNVARLIRVIDRGRFIWVGDGRNERSFVYVADVAEAILTALSLPDDIAKFNVTGGTMTIKEMVDNISTNLGRSAPANLVSFGAANFALAISTPLAGVPSVGRYQRTLETWLSNAVYSGAALANKGFVSTIDLREALKREVHYYLASKG
ncbi:MAG: NAD-dependent epimerase/dehydratase family protein [Pyrinomonadaceae bacterium]